MQNCWEFKKCGREVGGKNIKELGVCPAAINEKYDGLNHGKNAGRYCWKVAGTMCDGKIQGTFATKGITCLECDFFKQVFHEEKSKLKT